MTAAEPNPGVAESSPGEVNVPGGVEVDAVLADSAVAAEGKLYLQGGAWNILSAPVLPLRVPRIGLAIAIRVPWTATNEPHVFDVRLQDADGKVHPLGDAPPEMETDDGMIHHIETTFTVGRPPLLQPGDDQIVPIAINVDGLVFESAGRYEFVIAVDGSDVKHLPLRVIQVT